MCVAEYVCTGACVWCAHFFGVFWARFPVLSSGSVRGALHYSRNSFFAIAYVPKEHAIKKVLLSLSCIQGDKQIQKYRCGKTF